MITFTSSRVLLDSDVIKLPFRFLFLFLFFEVDSCSYKKSTNTPHASLFTALTQTKP